MKDGKRRIKRETGCSRRERLVTVECDWLGDHCTAHTAGGVGWDEYGRDTGTWTVDGVNGRCLWKAWVRMPVVGELETLVMLGHEDGPQNRDKVLVVEFREWVVIDDCSRGRVVCNMWASKHEVSGEKLTASYYKRNRDSSRMQFAEPRADTFGFEFVKESAPRRVGAQRRDESTFESRFTMDSGWSPATGSELGENGEHIDSCAASLGIHFVCTDICECWNAFWDIPGWNQGC